MRIAHAHTHTLSNGSEKRENGNENWIGVENGREWKKTTKYKRWHFTHTISYVFFYAIHKPRAMMNCPSAINQTTKLYYTNVKQQQHRKKIAIEI